MEYIVIKGTGTDLICAQVMHNVVDVVSSFVYLQIGHIL